RQPDRVVKRGQVGQRLAAHLAEGVTGDERRRAEPARQRLRGLEHQPPLRHDLQPAGAGCREALLRLAERDHEQPGLALEPVQLVVASSAEVAGNRLSRRRARTANEPVFPAIMATAVSMAAWGCLATRTALQTLAMPMTSRARSAILSTAASAPAAPPASPSP